MSKFFKSFLHCFIILAIISFSSCSNDEDPVEPEPDPTLNAKAGPNQEAEVSETVTLDGSESTGPEGFTYSWEYEGLVSENEIDFRNKTSATPTFIPPKPGLYEFILTVSHGDSTDVDETVVIVGGAIEIGGTLTEDLELKNIQGDANKPDFIVVSDLIVPDGITLSIIEDDVIIEFNSETGIHVQEGGLFTNLDDENSYGYTSELRGENGWKGILIEKGTIGLDRALIINAGKTAFDGQDEPAAISFSSSLSTIESLSYNEFVNSFSYDILTSDRVLGTGFPVRGNKLSYTIPIKAQIRFMELWTSDEPNISPEEYDYIQLIPRGSDLKDEANSVNGFNFRPSGTQFYIDGDFWAASDISVGENCTIFMKENSGILYEQNFRLNEGSLITGLENKTWKGIAASNDAFGLRIHEAIVENAGYGRIISGGVYAKADAALYWSGNGNTSNIVIENSLIKNCGSFGFYDATDDITYTRFEDNTFNDIDSAAIFTNLRNVGIVISKMEHGNTFILSDNAVAVQVGGDGSARDTWYDLGDDHYYLIDADYVPSSFDLTIEAGVHLKFKENRFFNWNPSNMDLPLRVNGTAENPVVFEGEENTPGSWGGAYLRGLYIVKYAEFKNGGGFTLADDLNDETANVVTVFNGTQEQLALIENCTIENSTGYGIIAAPLSLDYMWNDPKWNNTFINNADGDYLNMN